MSGRDLKKDALTKHKARSKAGKRKNDALPWEPKRSGNFFRNFGRGRGRVTQSDEVVAVSNQEGASEITPSNERSGVQDIIHGRPSFIQSTADTQISTLRLNCQEDGVVQISNILSTVVGQETAFHDFQAHFRKS
ncbi:hypothetical protein DAPPUDRAFT_110692 [Daphnia pulex]|uniref:Uncharacterized protein n=1 Tax=Daphnia pulex TaxID=6669 RepID=E9H713_DAPPU|nr:hypothetical protein DAPPUDRAFT_110692 [Daphnia pulex]|eukprot:EFX72523.1 hypothetical protein DAPPUDRAFT_110692 [Daphnia pulex]